VKVLAISQQDIFSDQ